jgi:hypothetical protein
MIVAKHPAAIMKICRISTQSTKEPIVEPYYYLGNQYPRKIRRDAGALEARNE